MSVAVLIRRLLPVVAVVAWGVPEIGPWYFSVARAQTCTVTCGTGACQRTVTGCVQEKVCEFDPDTRRDICYYTYVDPTCTPGQPTAETCDGTDNDCDGYVDDGVKTTFYRDLDGDGYGATSSGTAQACTAPSGYRSNNRDCNDNNPYVNPDQTKECGSGACFRSVSACTQQQVCEYDSTNKLVCHYENLESTCTPGQPTAETCDGVDNDCNGYIDNATGVSASNTLQRSCNPNACTSAGSQVCSAGAWSACSGCSGTAACSVCGGTGAATCNNSCGIGVCTRAEACNNCDDDANGVVDNGLYCPACSY